MSPSGSRSDSSHGDLPLPPRRLRRRWRDYTAPAGNRPVREFILGLSVDEGAAVTAAMAEVARSGLEAARHLRGDIYEVRAWAANRTFRILFAEEGRLGQVLLALAASTKKTRRTPKAEIDLAIDRRRGGRGCASWPSFALSGA